MKNKTLFRKINRLMATAVLTGALILSGCSDTANVMNESQTSAASVEQTSTESSSEASEKETGGSGTAQTALSGVSTLDISDMFSKRDQSAEYEEAECILITLNGDTAECENSNVTIDGSTVVIKAAGSYILRGTLNGSVRIEAGEADKIQLILDGAEISSEGTAAIYVKEADKVFITLAENSSNRISNSGEFAVIDENNIDGAVFSKTDLTLNGSGSLTIISEKGHGIVSKDDLKITGGTYEITAGGHGISGKDSIRIADGTISITSGEDGLHSGNDEDTDKGYVYIAGGSIQISAEDDGIHGESNVAISDGTINISKSYEGIEAAVVEIAGGDITETASDDGINATDGSGTEGFGFGGNRQSASSADSGKEVYVLISGGRLNVNAKGDGLDSNGKIYVKGGEIYVSGPENNGNGALDYDSEGEITGGIIIATGSTGMAMNFSSSTQGTALITLNSTHNAGETVELTDSQGNVLISFTPSGKFASVLVSCPGMVQNGTYTLTAGSEKQEFTLDDLVYGKSNGFGGMGGGPKGDFSGGKPEGFDGNFGEMPEGFDGNFEGRPEMPEGFDGNFGEMPEGFDGNFEGRPEMPEGFNGNFGEMPEGFDGNFEGRPGKSGGFGGGTDSENGREGGTNEKQSEKKQNTTQL